MKSITWLAGAAILPSLLACTAFVSGSSGDGAAPAGPLGTGGSALSGGGTTAAASGGVGNTAGGAGALTAGAGPGFGGPISSASAVRKVKNVLTGLAVTDAELASGVNAAGLASLIDAWTKTPEFEQKMLLFFQNGYQQSSLAVLDFEFQLRKRPGAFDLPYAIYGDNAFPLLFQNMKESFARTAIEFVKTKRPMSDLLTTDELMMTTALKSLYMQIEAPYDIHTMNFKFNHGARPPLSETLDPSSANYMTFGYEAPTTSAGKKFSGTCAGDATKVSTCPGNTNLFQVLLGVIGRDSGNNTTCSSNMGCMEHAIKPYFTPQDLSDWQLVKIVKGTALMPWNLSALRSSGASLNSQVPRISFFSTPAFFAVWNTNDSNEHRVTANQALLGALGQGFSSVDSIIRLPPTTTAVDGVHATDGSLCYGCHKSLDPMRQFWGNSFDFNEKPFAGKSAGPASFGFGNVAKNGASLKDFGGFLNEVTDEQVEGDSISRFALELTQKLCYFANSAQCEETDPEMRRVAHAFVDSQFDFYTLVRELYSSPLVTASANTATFSKNGVTISIARRDQLCQALSVRLGRPDICEIAVPAPTNVTTAMNRLAGALPADGFSRGVAAPVTAPDPNLFFRAASELLCEAIAAKVVDGAGATFSSADSGAAIESMVTKIMGVPPSDPKHAASVTTLTSHFTDAKAKGDATSALRSTFSAACQSPPVLALGI
jgi:hypothetical protein